MSEPHSDTQGRLYLTKDEAHAGQRITVDGGFTCIDLCDERIICSNEHGLYFLCRDGHHYLNGQETEDGKAYVGVYPIRTREQSDAPTLERAIAEALTVRVD